MFDELQYQEKDGDLQDLWVQIENEEWKSNELSIVNHFLWAVCHPHKLEQSTYQH